MSSAKPAPACHPTMAKPDPEIVEAVQASDMAGFAALYDKHYRLVYSICLRMMVNPADAEDMAQEVFIQLHRKLGSFRGDSQFTTWLHRLTINQVLMHFRKPARTRELVTDDGELPDQVDPATVQSEARLVGRISLERAIAQLPPGYRTVFVLHDVDGYAYTEIGERLGCSEGNAKSQRHKAMMRLRKLLTHEMALQGCQ